MSRKLIALGGKLRAGKDAIGDYLVEKHDFVKLGMSDALNEALLALDPYILTSYTANNGTVHEHVERYSSLYARVGYVEAKTNPEVRRLLQKLGTEVGREMIDPDVWVNIAQKKILEHWASGKDVVITAMRFPNELEMVKRLGGVAAWVERPESSRIDSEGLRSSTGRGTPGSASEGHTEVQGAIQAHASENSVSASDFSLHIRNQGTLEELYESVETILTVQWVDDPQYSELSVGGGYWIKAEDASLVDFAPPYDR